MDSITTDDFAKVEMRVGLVMECASVEGSDKLLREVVDFGEIKHEIRAGQPQPQRDIRVIYSGLRKWYQPEELIGKKFIYIVNLEPRPIMGEESQGMILVVEGEDRRPVLVPISDEVPVGALAR